VTIVFFFGGGGEVKLMGDVSVARVDGSDACIHTCMDARIERGLFHIEDIVS